MMQILSLAGNHNRQSFDCGRIELNNWLRQVARQHQDKGLSKTFVAVSDEEPTGICGFYALTLAEMDRRFLPETYQKRIPHRIPGVRLGRLAVDVRYQKKGLGELILVDAIARARRIHQDAGVMGIFVDALDNQASAFYRHYGFLAIHDHPRLLIYPIA